MEKTIKDKSKEFAIAIISLYKYLTEGNIKNEFVLSKQVLRSGTSIGANISEAVRAQSKADFASKMNIALKEACETAYWLELLSDTHYLDDYPQKNDILNDCVEINKILTSIVKTTYDNIIIDKQLKK